MKHQRLLDPSHSPREGFPFKDPATGYTSLGKTLAALFTTARLHRTANDIPVPDDFDLQIETAICAQGIGECVNRDGSPLDMSCTHRGKEVRREVCESCGGNVTGIVLACALHGECTLFKKDLGKEVMQCGTCKDRVPAIAS